MTVEEITALQQQEHAYQIAVRSGVIVLAWITNDKKTAAIIGAVAAGAISVYFAAAALSAPYGPVGLVAACVFAVVGIVDSIFSSEDHSLHDAIKHLGEFLQDVSQRLNDKLDVVLKNQVAIIDGLNLILVAVNTSAAAAQQALQDLDRRQAKLVVTARSGMRAAKYQTIFNVVTAIRKLGDPLPGSDLSTPYNHAMTTLLTYATVEAATSAFTGDGEIFEEGDGSLATYIHAEVTVNRLVAIFPHILSKCGVQNSTAKPVNFIEWSRATTLYLMCIIQFGEQLHVNDRNGDLEKMWQEGDKVRQLCDAMSSDAAALGANRYVYDWAGLGPEGSETGPALHEIIKELSEKRHAANQVRKYPKLPFSEPPNQTMADVCSKPVEDQPTLKLSLFHKPGVELKSSFSGRLLPIIAQVFSDWANTNFPCWVRRYVVCQTDNDGIRHSFGRIATGTRIYSDLPMWASHVPEAKWHENGVASETRWSRVQQFCTVSDDPIVTAADTLQKDGPIITIVNGLIDPKELVESRPPSHRGPVGPKYLWRPAVQNASIHIERGPDAGKVLDGLQRWDPEEQIGASPSKRIEVWAWKPGASGFQTISDVLNYIEEVNTTVLQFDAVRDQFARYLSDLYEAKAQLGSIELNGAVRFFEDASASSRVLGTLAAWKLTEVSLGATEKTTTDTIDAWESGRDIGYAGDLRNLDVISKFKDEMIPFLHRKLLKISAERSTDGYLREVMSLLYHRIVADQEHIADLVKKSKKKSGVSGFDEATRALGAMRIVCDPGVDLSV